MLGLSPSPVGWISDLMWNLPPGLAALVGSIVGLMAVALSAFLGFYTLRRGQERQSEFSRKQERQRRHDEMIALAALMRAEIEAAIERCERHIAYLEYIANPHDDADIDPVTRMGVQTGALKGMVPYPHISGRLFDANARRLFLLPPHIVRELVAVHDKFIRWIGINMEKGRINVKDDKHFYTQRIHSEMSRAAALLIPLKEIEQS